MIYIRSRFENIGITVLEMLLVIAIIGILSILAVQRMSRYTMDSHVRTIDSSVKTLFDLMDRYYLSVCLGSTLSRQNGSSNNLNKNNFINKNLISESSYDDTVIDPFLKDSNAYSFSMQYLRKTNSQGRMGAFWIASVVYQLPSDITDENAAIYASKLKPTSANNSNHTLTWRQTITTRVQDQGSVLSPGGNDIKRFSIQQYVPIGNLYSGADGKLYDQDYDQSYRPVNSADSCEVYEEQNLSSEQFYQKRAMH